MDSKTMTSAAVAVEYDYYDARPNNVPKYKARGWEVCEEQEGDGIPGYAAEAVRMRKARKA